MSKNKDFYDSKRAETYAQTVKITDPQKHSFYNLLQQFIGTYSLQDKKCLEIGSGTTGLFQDIVPDYTGTDIAESIQSNYRKPYFATNADGTYPFADNSFDAIWTITVYEHIPELDIALNEIKRILKPEGVVLFAPAWECTSWAADGYPVRPYSDFRLKGKLIKLSIPIRNARVFRLLFKIPKRLFRHSLYLLGYRHRKINYKKLKPNWEKYWMSDSDACNSIDTHDAILWFESNGFSCLSHPMPWRALTCHSAQGLVFRKR